MDSLDPNHILDRVTARLGEPASADAFAHRQRVCTICTALYEAEWRSEALGLNSRAHELRALRAEVETGEWDGALDTLWAALSRAHERDAQGEYIRKAAHEARAEPKRQALIPLMAAIADSASERVTSRSLCRAAAEYLDGWEGNEACEAIAAEIMRGGAFPKGAPAWKTIRDIFDGWTVDDMTGVRPRS